MEARVHDVLGVAVRWPGDSHWWVRLGKPDSNPQRMADHAVRGRGWREVALVASPVTPATRPPKDQA